MTFLELCVRVHQQSGLSGTPPAATANQIGVLAKLVGWVRDADMDIQRSKADWPFLWRRAQSALVAGQQQYTPLELGLAGLATISRIRSGNQPVRIVSFDTWLDRYDMQGNGQGMVQVMTVAPDGQWWCYPTPDAAYPLTVDYYRAPVALVADNDVSPIPAAYHECIVQKALMYYARFEEDQTLMQLATMEYEQKLTEMCRDCLPKMGFEGGLY